MQPQPITTVFVDSPPHTGNLRTKALAEAEGFSEVGIKHWRRGRYVIMQDALDKFWVYAAISGQPIISLGMGKSFAAALVVIERQDEAVRALAAAS